MRTIFTTASVLVLSAGLVACGDAGDDDVTTDDMMAQLTPRVGEPFEPLPEEHGQNEEIAALGMALYHDTRLSGDGTLSCASCHNIAEGGDDGLPTSVGINGQLGPINSPTVLNSRYNIAQFWDGRAESLEAQALGPVANPIEMGDNWDAVVAELKEDEGYVAQFAGHYEDGITAENVAHAIATYERTLITPNSPFDMWLKGADTLSDAALAGYQTFKDMGCASCHTGPAIGGEMFARFGMTKSDEELEAIFGDNVGRMAVTGEDYEKYAFKVPTRRNVALTAPYFHDASAETLDEAVRIMADWQLGQTLTDEEAANLVAFLESLTGDIPLPDLD